MIRMIEFQCKIEKFDTHEIYTPPIVSFSTMKSLPLNSAPSATITIIKNSNLNDVKSVSRISYYDIVRLQVSVRYSDLEKPIWVDIFEGKVENQSKILSSNDNITFQCKGHISAAYDALIKDNKTFSNKDVSYILETLTTSYSSKLKYKSEYVKTGLIVTEYNTEAEQNYLIDAYKEAEKVSGYSMMIDVVPSYSVSGVLENVYLEWKPLSTTPTAQYLINEYSPRLISASFDIVGEDVRNIRYVKGGTNESGVTYSSVKMDSGSIAKYGEKYIVDRFSWVKSNQLCADIAAGLLEDSKDQYVSAQVVLEGTIDAKIGDLVSVYIPSLELMNVQIDGNYTVYRVNHIFNEDEFNTILDLGRIKKDEYDYINKNITQVLQTCYKNQAK